jgi:Na+-transporting NADH:ubiquinone oxidoreductase subunit F
MYILTPVIVLTAITLVLGILILLVDRFLADYGECTITVNGSRELTVRGGASIHSLLAANRIFIPSACGGKATCGLCKGKVLTDVGPLLPTERPFMSKQEFRDNTRLLCQVKVKKDLDIVIPEEYFLVKEFKTVVEAIVPLTHDTRMIRFKLLEPDAIEFKAGQFIQFRIPGAGEERAYSIASSPHDNQVVELIIRLVPGGLATSYIFNKLKVGEPIFLTGPYGEFYLRETDAPLVCVAGGSGSAPIRAIIHYLRGKNSPRKVVSFYGGRTPRDIYFTDEYSKYAAEMDLTHIPAISEPSDGDSWVGERGLITAPMARHLGDLSNYEAYMCGPPAMLFYARKLLISKGINPEKVYFDEF